MKHCSAIVPVLAQYQNGAVACHLYPSYEQAKAA
jgi:hypothetical protein